MPSFSDVIVEPSDGVGVGIGVLVGSGVIVGVGGRGVAVDGSDVAVDGVVVDEPHALNKTARNVNARKTDPINFFMTFSPFDLIMQGTAQRFALPACGRAWTLLGSRKNPKPEKCL